MFAGALIAGEQEPCDNCLDQVIWYVIVNDQDYTTGIQHPSGPTTTTCCPVWDDTLTHINFPDTLAFTGTVDSALAVSAPNAYFATTNAGWNISGTTFQIPPMTNECCCVDGIYWKARMWESSDGSWSAWTDVNAPGQSNTSFSGTLIALVNTGAFKTRDFGGNMVFDCNSDSIFLYGWDCNDGDIPGSYGEFGVSARTFPDPVTVGGTLMDSLFLRRWMEPGAIGDKPKLPNEFFLSQNTPNPFNAKTVIEYGLPEDAEVEIQITNLLGQKVSTLVSEYQTAGFKRVIWDGRDNSGRDLPSGVYFYNIRAKDFSAKKRAILMK